MKTLEHQLSHWEKYCGRPLDSFERLVVSRPYRENSCGEWSRVLKPCLGGILPFQIEVPLSQIIEHRSFGIEHKKGVYIGQCTHGNLGNGDTFVSSVPTYVRADLDRAFGYEFSKYILFNDFVSLDSWPKGPTFGAGCSRINDLLCLITMEEAGFSETAQYR